MEERNKTLYVSKCFNQYRAEDLERIISDEGCELTLLAIAHNMNKLHNKIQSERTGTHLFKLKKAV